MTRSDDVLRGFAPPVPPAAVDRWHAYVRTRDEGGPAAVPRRAGSVVLVRDGGAGLEVYLLHRHARMPFAASVAAFPGGGVDPVDGAVDGTADGTADGTVDGTADGETDPVVRCALRETREETTVVLDAATLVPWARWVTPAYEPRRYDTSFFLAVLPGRQQARDVSGETDHAEWVRPGDALAARTAGTLSLMPPTWSILAELATFPDTDAARAAGGDREVVLVEPRLVRDGATWRFAYGAGA